MKEELLDFLKKEKVDQFPEGAEALRLGPIFMDPDYPKKYRYITFEELKACVLYLKTMNIEDFDYFFDGLEETVKINTENGIMYGELIENEHTKLFRDFLSKNDIDITLTTGMTYFVTCLIEAYY